MDARKAMAKTIATSMPEAMLRTEACADETMQLEQVLRERIEQLPYEQFEELCHSVFKQDEWMLIAVGGLLGAAVGFGQTLMFKFSS